MTGIVLADDHAAFADALAAVLENHGLEILAVERTLRDTVVGAGRWRPDLCVTDRWFEDGDVLTALPDLHAIAPATKVVVLTADTDRDAARQALDGGARGFVHKTRGVSALLDAIDRVAAGQTALELPPRWTQGQGRPAAVAHPPVTPLTARERECLALLVEGASTGEMATRLGVGSNTVRSHVQALMTKLDVHTRLEAAAYAVRHGLVATETLEHH